MQNSTIKLGEIAHARSGDKGNHANLGVIAFTPAGFEYLRDTLTTERMREFFSDLSPQRVERFELPRVQAFNFMLHHVLAGGASLSLKIDTQGKLLGTAVLELELPRPANWSEMLAS